MSVTREEIDEALAVWDLNDPLRNDAMLEAIIEAARLGRILTQSQCPTCGGSGLIVTYNRARITATWTCPSCGGSGKEWPIEIIRAISQYTASAYARLILDLLAALAEEE